jgi:hypothetical protein
MSWFLFIYALIALAVGCCMQDLCRHTKRAPWFRDHPFKADAIFATCAALWPVIMAWGIIITVEELTDE